ncbi:MAG: mannose-1-phosphate guanylyltransferase/mannose-6-phosphate isomerase [Aquificaceae bacterium]
MKAIILAGGSGTRLWPLSRQMYPKQFLRIIDERSLLRATFERVLSTFKEEDILVVTHKDYKNHVINDLYPYDRFHLLAEPERKNTGPAISYAISYITHHLKPDPNEVIAVFASDHYISPDSEFMKMVKLGIEVAKAGYFVVFGIKPTSPDPNFGYIKRGEALMQNPPVYKIEEFVEKPPLEKAKSMIESGQFFWNSGNFIFTLEAFLNFMEKKESQIYEFIKTNQMLKNYKLLKEISFDYMVMERVDNGAVMPLEVIWSDIGSFEGLYRVLKENGQHCKGDTICLDGEDNLILSTGRLICTIGVSNLAIVEEKDAVLVISRDKSQKVRDLVKILSEQKRPEAFFHKEINLPWGRELTLEESPSYSVFKLQIFPSREIPKRMHLHHNRIWTILSGTAIFHGSKEEYLVPGQSVFIERAKPYSIKNIGLIPLEIIEVRVGEYLKDEDTQYVET